MPEFSRPLRVAMIGHGFMGAAHSQGWRVAPRVFDLASSPVMQVIVGRNSPAVAAAAAKWGWAEHSVDWRDVVERDDIDVVDIVTPGNSHAEIAVAALAAGKRVLCEKPLANSVEEAIVMADASRCAAERGIFSMVGFTYRRVPAIAFARELVREGKLGDLRQVRAEYLQDWLVDPEAPLTWRMKKEFAGSGALGDIGAHAIDLAQFVTGDPIEAVSGILRTFVSERPVLEAPHGLSGTASGQRGEVTVDDLALFTGRFRSGALGSFEASRMRTGRKNALRLEISGSLGSISFDLERQNSLQFYDATARSTTRGFTEILVTEPGHPYLSGWWPAGHMLGYDHSFSNQVFDFVSAIDAGKQPRPSFDEGLQVQRVLAAVDESSDSGSAWISTIPVPAFA
ncbi:putative dehydrogenase [Glaciihabitans sp. GrIS 2.15]|nr:putative dehydrogenase [Glaciihabitans sp. GrIS 2.15]